MPYRSLDPRTELEQAVTADLKSALDKRGAVVTHYGKPASPAPASAPCDIAFEYGKGPNRRAVMVEVAQRTEASEFQSIVSHLEVWIATRGPAVNLLYSGRATSARMARLVRNENERRAALGLPGRIIFLKLDDLEAFIERWRSLPASEVPVARLDDVFARFADCKDDLTAAEVFREVLFPDWLEKKSELSAEAKDRLVSQQERLKRDIQGLENKLRESGVTGPRAHKYLIYLFFMALYEDQRGKDTRATKQGLMAYRDAMSNKDKAEFHDRTVHHLLSRNILEDPDVKHAGIPSQYEAIEISDSFVLERVIPVFESYSFADASIDAIGAVFEALARRAEKDNRIGQFFTPETAVTATCRLAGIRPTDLVADPACGTGRFLIRAMAMMCVRADQVAGLTQEQALQRIKKDLLLGSDIDPWIAIIAKMNMYIHGDGKSNIRHANGLTLASVASFAPEHPDPLSDALDVIVTNPPLGDINFGDVAEEAARTQLAAAGNKETPEALRAAASEWSKFNLEVIPHTVVEEEASAAAAKKADEWRLKAVKAQLEGDAKAEVRAKTRVAEWEAKQKAADQAIGSGKVTYRAAGRVAKGGALFLSSLAKCLKPCRDASLPLEWRGGVLGLIIDEAVLNTPQYAQARGFIRHNYFIKAIVSLPRDTFADLAKTTAKTSILLLVRKEDPDVVQREPVVFARAELTGPAGRNLKRANDLDAICDGFDAWRESLIGQCKSAGADVPTPAFVSVSASALEAAAKAAAKPRQIQMSAWALDPALPQERLDEAHWCKKGLVNSITNAVSLSDVTDLVSSGRVPPELDIYSFASVSRVEARVRFKGLTDTQYSTDSLQQVQENDILVSGIDLVHGSVAVVGAECAGMVVSKEYFILRAKPDIEPFWVAALLRTRAMRRIIEGTVTGTSNRTRVESPDVLMNLPIPAAPSKIEQEAIGSLLRDAGGYQKAMVKSISDAEMRAAAIAALPFDTLAVEPEFAEASPAGNEA